MSLNNLSNIRSAPDSLGVPEYDPDVHAGQVHVHPLIGVHLRLHHILGSSVLGRLLVVIVKLGFITNCWRIF